MFRLTAVLLVCLYATMSIWGGPPGDDVVVSRAESLSPALPALAAADDPPARTGEGLSALSDSEAVQAAMAAGTTAEERPVTVAVAPPEEEDEARFVYVTGSRVNLRNGPTTNSAVVGSVSRGDRAEPLSDLGDSWVRIRTERGIEAWIYGRFLSETPA